MSSRALRVAVVSELAAEAPTVDGCGLPGTAETAAAQLQRPGLRATAVGDVATLVEAPAPGPDLAGYDGAYLIGPGRRARLAERLPELGLPVVTQAHTHAVALGAELLRKLQQTRLPRRSSRVLVLGDAHDREVGDLVSALGVGEVVRWNPEDAVSYPLAVLARRMDVVLDVLGSAEHRREAMAIVLPPAMVALSGPGAMRAALEELLRGVLNAAPPRVTQELLVASAQRLASPSLAPLQSG